VLSPKENWLQCQLKKHALGLTSLERTMGHLRSWLNWLKEGDANTSYFYHRVRYKKCKNFIAKLKVGDQIKTEQGKKKRRHGTFTTICWDQQVSVTLP
jgi:hypothetical protein